MRTISVMAIFSAAAIWLPPVFAQEIPSASPAERAAQDQVRARNARVENHPQSAAEPSKSRDDRSEARRRIHAENGWKWTFDGERPSIDYRVDENASVRVRGMRGGAAIFVNWRF